ncbi:UNG-like protein [Mya arenaria]|uniref:Uracil-DNA glycosylase n=1 Tax=Mya arenaria TaxID=6604 RepID=A0ABY7FIK5_MYAAR|nr:UNG-like protein [Mya arenaria]
MLTARSTFAKLGNIMSGQAKISTFFTSKGKNNLEKTKDENTPPKKMRLDADSSPGKLTPPGDDKKSSPLSPEQKQRMAENREKALAKLHAKQPAKQPANQTAPSQTDTLLVNVGESWRTALEAEFSKTYFAELTRFVCAERRKGTVYPSPENVKVVILGQDPYHGPNQAHGLSFSVLPGVPAPPSLVNMYKELGKDIEGFKRPDHGYLQGWAKQGVLMLNAVLTVRARDANSHKDRGWEKLTDAVIAYLNKNKDGLVFVLWGSYAQKKGAHIDKGVHPSPLSAHRGFFGCQHFSKTNEFLQETGKPPIDWSHLPRDIE